MAKYRKKPVVIEATQWLPCGGEEKKQHPEMPYPPAPHWLLRKRGWWRLRWQIKTLEGWLSLAPFDWIICGIKDDWYPCKPDIFQATYEPVGP